MSRGFQEILQKHNAKGYVMSCYLNQNDLQRELREDFDKMVGYFKDVQRFKGQLENFFEEIDVMYADKTLSESAKDKFESLCVSVKMI